MTEFLGRDWTEISKHFGIDRTNEQEALIQTKAYIDRKEFKICRIYSYPCRMLGFSVCELSFH
jgi:hypothetical protein